jgi:hypothetical protein
MGATLQLLLCPGILPATANSGVGAFPWAQVYAGLVVVLITTVIHGLKSGRVRRIQQALQIDSRTLKRWCQWWLDSFVRSSFWKAARARLMPPICEAHTAFVVVVEL